MSLMNKITFRGTDTTSYDALVDPLWLDTLPAGDFDSPLTSELIENNSEGTNLTEVLKVTEPGALDVERYETSGVLAAPEEAIFSLKVANGCLPRNHPHVLDYWPLVSPPIAISTG